MAKWLDDAVFYEIYPQSFKDSNGDGIGDIPGIIEKLDYIKELGCNAIWMNPCFESPFMDAGYDVSDYKKIAKRYGTMQDMKRLIKKMHSMDMHLILDLVPGHTSEEHKWFKESKKADANEYSDRFIWTDWWLSGGKGLNFVAGDAERDGAYIVNFFKCQPALNYGFLNPSEVWQQGICDEGPMKTREAIKDIIHFWLDMGIDGFRVDMADSLVKMDDENKSGTISVWQDILSDAHKNYPEAAFVSEWGRPAEAYKAGFDMDFYLDWPGNGYNNLVRDWELKKPPFAYGENESNIDDSYFKKDGKGSIDKFLEEYMGRYEEVKDKLYIALISGNHDTPRISYGLTDDELKLFYTFLLTMPGTPFIYYGDEISMKYQNGMKTKEGGYTRTGSRTPMQWDSSKNLGFSSAKKKDLYLPVETGKDAVTAAKAIMDENSVYYVIKKVAELRHQNKDLINNGNLCILSKAPFVYQRGDIIVAINPKLKKQIYRFEGDKQKYEVLFSIGDTKVSEKNITLLGQSVAIIRKK